MALNSPRVSRALSAFDHISHRWVAMPMRDPNRAPTNQRPSPSHPVNAPVVGRQSLLDDVSLRRAAGMSLRDPNAPATTQRPSPPHESRPVNVGRQRLSLVTWNINAGGWKHVERAERIVSHILEGPKCPDILLLQEVVSPVREFLLGDARIRSRFLTTDAEDETAFKGVPFATMTLLSNKRFGSSFTEKNDHRDDGRGDSEGGPIKMEIDSVFRMDLPSRYKRDVLCINIHHPAVPDAILRLLNVHMDSLNSQFRRALQMVTMASLLREPRCKGGIIAGDFNANHPDDHTLVDRYRLVDAWTALHGSTTGPEGATWGVGVELPWGRGCKPGRLDKVVMLGLQPNEIEVLKPGYINASTPWSDHCGLHCTFTI
ncbi:Endonuclease/exonuclease/phosphatase [Ephemerocybe angulata]|uniref:Endonuclease/exonuclease/phosphatase n=1 Tax=Ephemerocybe angulata TaxID=980116 RepID=A0A8H6IH89_9AGAR|nr:Endonuclease/exonuclease/phosphatase [Tulosesus angulatus]